MGVAEAFLASLQGFPCYGGLDLGAVEDLTGFALVWPVGDRLYAHVWPFLPADELAERVRHDNVPYDKWAADGHVTLTPGPVTDWRMVREEVEKLGERFDIRSIGFDRFGARDVAGDLRTGGLTVEDVGQSFIGMSAPAKRLQQLVLTRQLVHCGHPVLRWNVDCCSVDQDNAGNIRPVKPDRKKSTKRIDLLVALVMAVGQAMNAGTVSSAPPEVW